MISGSHSGMQDPLSLPTQASLNWSQGFAKESQAGSILGYVRCMVSVCLTLVILMAALASLQME